jgi:hypothetical protein
MRIPVGIKQWMEMRERKVRPGLTFMPDIYYYLFIINHFREYVVVMRIKAPSADWGNKVVIT